MTENKQTKNPWEQLAIAVTTQEGPDGKWMVSIHLGTLAMSSAFVLPADDEEQINMIANGLADQIKMEARNARIKNGRISIISNGKLN